MPLPLTKRLVLDSDAAAFCNRSGATDRAAINAFVRGVKSLGLWESMVCWPLRSAQNAGTGTTAYSLGGLGTFNGTLVNGPAWGSDGLTVDATNKKITTSFNFSTATPSIFSVIRPDSAAAKDDRFMSNDEGGTNNGMAFDGLPAAQFRRLGSNLIDFGTRAANTRTAVGLGYGTNNTFTFQDGTRTTQTTQAYSVSPRTLCPVGCPDVGTALGMYSFSMVIDGAATTQSLLSSFYTIYKSTLGVGLGLP